MKKIAVLVLIALIGIGSAEAKLRFGVKLGTNIDHLSSNMGSNFDKNNRAGFTGGVMAEYLIPGINFGFDLGVQYAYMNSAISDNKNFLEIPVNLKYRITIPAISSIIAPYIFTGPSFDFKLDKNTVDAFKTKTFQTVWNVGLGIELVKHLQIGASYGFGMNTIAKVVNFTSEPIKYHNNYWTITAAYLF